MSAVRELVDILIGSGMHPADAAALMARAGAEMNVSGPSKAALRTRKWRASKPSPTVTGDAQSTPSPTVTERHQTSHCDVSQSAPLTKEDKKQERNKEKKEAVRGTRLPETWVPSEANISYALGKQFSQIRLDAEGRKFRNYWAAKSGQGATKVNWNLTWENWIDSTLEREGSQNGTRPHNPQRRSASSDFFAGIASVAADLNGHDQPSGPSASEVPLGRFNIDG